MNNERVDTYLNKMDNESMTEGQRQEYDHLCNAFLRCKQSGIDAKTAMVALVRIYANPVSIIDTPEKGEADVQ